MSEFAEGELSQADRLLPSVRQVMHVEDMTSGGSRDPFRARYRGRLRMPSEDAYQRLEPAFARESLTLFFRESGEQHVILGAHDARREGPARPWLNLLLFFFTTLSVLFAGLIYAANYVEAPITRGILPLLRAALPLGALYAFSLLAILVAHEFGHYLMGRYHGTPVSLPYFLPFPGSYFGTLGAFIRLKAPPRNRRALLDIGLAGPIAGLVVAVPVLLIGLAQSAVEPLPTLVTRGVTTLLEGNSIFYLAIKFLVKGQLLPAPIDYGGVPVWLYWARYILLSQPAPFGGLDVALHPMAWAGWAGLLVTGLNLIPMGQLDGGHTIYSFLGKRAGRLWPFMMVGLLALGLVWNGWFLFAVLIFFMGRVYAQPLDDITELDPKRKWIAAFGLILFLLVFTPVPLKPLGG